MKRLQINEQDRAGTERFTRRIQNGVMIIERETVQKIVVEDNAFSTLPRRTPRLVIDGAISRSKMLVSKSRSQLGEIDGYLRSLVRRPIGAK